MPVQVRQYAFLLFWTAFSLGLTLSPALISISLAGIALVGLSTFKTNPISRQSYWISALFLSYFIVNAMSYFYSTDTNEASRKIILKLPILLFPLFLLAFNNCRKHLTLALIIYAYSMYLPACVSIYNYFLNKQLYDLLILQSKPLPIEFGYGIYHIQFSILLAISILLCLNHLITNWKIEKDWQWYTILFLGSANLLFIHILSARTGLLALYVGAGIYFLLSFRKKGGKALVIGAIASITIFIVMVLLSSSLKNRISNTIQDLKVVINDKNPNDYSFALRVQAWKNSWDVIQENPLGVGIGDAEKTLFDNFEKVNPRIEKDNRKNPHFQILETGVQSGWPSMILYLSILIYIVMKFSKNHLLIGVTCLLFLASCFESILERQASVAGFAIFIAFALAYSESKRAIEHSPTTSM